MKNDLSSEEQMQDQQLVNEQEPKVTQSLKRGLMSSIKKIKQPRSEKQRKSFAKGLFPRSDDQPEERYYKILIWSIVGVFFLIGLVSLGTLMIALRGPETVIIPDLRNMEFVEAAEMLQDRGLGVRVIRRFFSDPNLRGRVVEQSPAAGGLIRAGRSITVTVSRGAVVDQVESFVGRPLDQVRQELSALFANFQPLLLVDDNNISFVFDDAEPGTILAQDPSPGTQLAGPTPLMLLVSRGPEVVSFPAPDFTRVDFRQAIQLLAARNQPFRFQLEPPDSTISPGLVTSQVPAVGAQIRPDTVIQMTMQPLRAVPTNQLFGIFERTLPRYAVPVELQVELLTPQGNRSILFSMRHPGGLVSIPYLAPINSQIIVSAMGAEVFRYIVVRE
jgi:beta-lactam-binding protein with PASTA domain